ncbi:MAG: hypothetical protein ACM3VS_04345 [Candidatus Dadabacteria bacterium]
MRDLTINVGQVEEWQTLNDINALEGMFNKAKSTIVNGACVLLVRKDSSGKSNKFDQLDTLDELEEYKQNVYKYLKI